MSFEDVSRHFTDISKMDPGLPLSAKIYDILKDMNRPIENRHIYKLLRNVSKSKNPRLY
jgi:hypothetical protein